MSFNILDDPWVPVLTHSGVEQVGLHDAVTRSHEFLALAAETPLEQVSILRTALAYIHRAISGPRDVSAWAEIWKSGRFPAELLGAYRERWHHRFFLDGDEPFYQTPGLSDDKMTHWFDGMIADNRGIFASRRGESVRALSDPEAARWLVLRQNFDGTGTKTGSKHDPEVKAGKISAGEKAKGWADRLVNIHAFGGSVFETLMLNLVGYDADPDDLAAWERPVAEPTRTHRLPAGRCDVYTWQAARLLLQRDVSGEITGVVRCSGDFSSLENAMELEPLTTWRFDPDKSKKSGKPVFVPAPFAASDQMWRGMGQFSTGATASFGEIGVSVPAPGVREWIGKVSSETGIDYHVVWHQTAVRRGGKGTFIRYVMADHLDMPIGVLTVEGFDALLSDQVSLISRCVWLYSRLCEQLTIVSGYRDIKGSAGSSGEGATSEAYLALDPAVRSWIAQIDVEGNIDVQVQQLRRVVYKTLVGMADQRLESLPPSAWRASGRYEGEGKQKREVPSPAVIHSNFVHTARSKLIDTQENS